MKFNNNAIKATALPILVAASSIVLAVPSSANNNNNNNGGYNNDGGDRGYPKSTPTPTPYCPIPAPSGPSQPSDPNGPSAVPEPSAWISFAIGSALIVGLTLFNKSKAAKSKD